MNDRDEQFGRAAFAFALAAILGYALSLAFVHEDAFITFRVIDNLWSGSGPVYNLGERVQVFTHPLWMFALAALWPTGIAPYFLALLLGFACTAGALWIAWRLMSGAPARATGMLLLAAALAANASFIDFSTSGLENPASHLLAAALAAAVLAGDRQAAPFPIRAIGLAAALLALNRLDLGLLAAPALCWVAKRGLWDKQWATASRQLALGLAPLLLWLLFAAFYFGSPFPNTLPAKTGAYRAGEAIVQGINYISDFAAHEPLAFVLAAAAFALIFMRGGTAERLLAAGAALYLLYVVQIGGDYIRGRFLTTPYFLLMLLAARRLALELPAAALAAPQTLLALACLALPLIAIKPEETDDRGRIGIQSPREWLGSRLALSRLYHAGVDTYWAAQGRNFKAAADRAGEISVYLPHTLGAGQFAYYAGPKVKCYDAYGLADPFIARLPAMPNPLPGHFFRPVPPAYLALRGMADYTAETARAAVLPAARFAKPDPTALGRMTRGERALWEHVRLLGEEPLFAPGRARAVLKELLVGRRMTQWIIEERRQPVPNATVEVAHAIEKFEIRPGGIEIAGWAGRPDAPVVALWNGIRLPDAIFIDGESYKLASRARLPRRELQKRFENDPARLNIGFEFYLAFPSWTDSERGELALGFEGEGRVDVFARIPMDHPARGRF